MSISANTEATALIASDSATDAVLVKKLMSSEFGKVFTSTNLDKAAADFDQQRPDVLVLAFNTLDLSILRKMRPDLITGKSEKKSLLKA